MLLCCALIPGAFLVSAASDEVRSFLNRAEACRAAAEVADSPEVRALYFNLANEWEELARQVEQREAEGNNGRGP
jgi:hypothetical protein